MSRTEGPAGLEFDFCPVQPGDVGEDPLKLIASQAGPLGRAALRETCRAFRSVIPPEEPLQVVELFHGFSKRHGLSKRSRAGAAPLGSSKRWTRLLSFATPPASRCC